MKKSGKHHSCFTPANQSGLNHVVANSDWFAKMAYYQRSPAQQIKAMDEQPLTPNDGCGR